MSSFRRGIPIGGGDTGAMTSETPTGTINGVNKNFELPYSPATLFVFLNGVLQKLGDDYTLSGTTITFTLAPEVGDVISAALG